VAAAPAGEPIATLPAFTAFMISSSLGMRVPPWNRTSSAPFDRLVTSLAIHSNAMPPESGAGRMWAKSSFFGAV
jgi:hypothetical protein